jgi:glyoxylase-like metal-dependent hydrolase (beta-lactamase superfamily II)
MRLGTRVVSAFALFALIGALAPSIGAAQTQPPPNMPPQTLPQGYESIDALQMDASANASAPRWSAWIVESSRFMGVAAGGFMPDRAKEPPVDLPVNVGILKAANGKITLYDSGWQQQDYIYRFNGSCCFAALRDQMLGIGLNPDDVTDIVIGHGHWDHAGQLDQFQNAVLWVQKEELKAIDWALSYPDPKISAWNTMSLGTGTAAGTGKAGDLGNTCARSPACGYPPQTLMQISGKIMSGKAQVIDGRKDLGNGLIIHPAFRGHTYGAQLLQANTANGQMVFGSDTYSSWLGIKDWQVANIQQTDTVQQFLAYEKCYVLSGIATDQVPTNCIAAHEPLSYSNDYPITKSWWNIMDASGKKLNCSRAAELSLANGESSHMPSNPDQVKCVSVPATLPMVNPETTNPGVPK